MRSVALSAWMDLSLKLKLVILSDRKTETGAGSKNGNSGYKFVAICYEFVAIFFGFIPSQLCRACEPIYSQQYYV